MAEVISVDDRNSSIVYFGNWFNAPSNNDPVFDDTLSLTSEISSGFSYNFNGTAISVFGTVGATQSDGLPPVSTYKLDGKEPVPYVAGNLTEEADGLLFFSAVDLAPGEHELLVNVTQASKDNPYLFDYLTYVPTVNVSSAPTGATTSGPIQATAPIFSASNRFEQVASHKSTSQTQLPSTSSPTGTSSSAWSTSLTRYSLSTQKLSSSSLASVETSSQASVETSSQTSVGTIVGPGTSATASFSPFPISSPLSSASGSPVQFSVRSNKPTGAIVGGAIGGMALLIMSLFGMWYCYRKRPSSQYKRSEQDRLTEIPRRVRNRGITPYLLSRDYSNAGTNQRPYASQESIQSQSIADTLAKRVLSPADEYLPVLPYSPPVSTSGAFGFGRNSSLLAMDSSSSAALSSPITESPSELDHGRVLPTEMSMRSETTRPVRQLPQLPRPPFIDSGVGCPTV